MGKIQSIKAREILDSRGCPTVEVELATEEGIFFAQAPSGTSKGEYEAVEIRDGGKRFSGKGVLKAVQNIETIIAPRLRGEDVINQEKIDQILIDLDGTKDKSRLGVNAVLPASVACCKAGAVAREMSLYQYIAEFYGEQFSVKFTENCSPLALPTPCFNILEGGEHAGNELDIQEFMLIPEMGPYRGALRLGAEVYQALKGILEKKFGKLATNVGQEGGFAPPVKKTQEALDFIMQAIQKAGYKNKIFLGLDVAASEFYSNERYKFEGKNISRGALLDFYKTLLKKYPILFIEDPFAQDDIASWRLLKSKIKNQKSKIFIVGDDLTATNPKRIKMAQEKMACDGVIIKPNQIGTVSEAIEAVKLAKSFGWKIIASHRAGETEDDFIADFAVGVGADFVKFGAPARGERVVKYNRLLRIGEEIAIKSKIQSSNACPQCVA